MHCSEFEDIWAIQNDDPRINDLSGPVKPIPKKPF